MFHLLKKMCNKSVLVIEDIDCCCDAVTSEDETKSRAQIEGDGSSDSSGQTENH
jgi:SET domain-containing protein